MELLAREAPGFVRIESQTPLRDAGSGASQSNQGPRLMVRIDRSADLDAVRSALTEAAAVASERLSQIQQL